MVAIVIYKEANLIAIISIIISMLSVASKSFVFSIASALTLKQLFFNWLSAVTDFFGIFCILSWVFYQTNDDQLNAAFNTIQTVWLYRIYCCTLPMVGSAALLCFVGFNSDFWPNSRDYYNTLSLVCARIGTISAVALVCICGFVAGLLSFEIMSFVWPAATLWYLGTNRFPEDKVSSEFYFTVIGWINEAKKHRVGSMYKGCTSFTKYQDKMIRLSSFHTIILMMMGLDHGDRWGFH